MTAIGWCWLAPTSVMAVFIALNGGKGPDWERVLDTLFEFGHANQVEIEDAPMRPEKIEGIQKTGLAENRPEWTRREDVSSDDVRRVVLASQLWSTEEEANEELRCQTGALVRRDFERRHHGLLDPEGIRFLSDERAVEVAVKQRYVERVDQDFGTFTGPMNRVLWQVELSPMIRTEIYPAWKKAVVENRIIAVGTILAVFTLLVNEGVLFYRLKRQPNGSAMRAAVVTAGSVTAWIAAELVVASNLLT
jgi:hypothetical protein